jgi:hypothetical protein
MSDTQPNEDIQEGLTVYSVDDEDQLQPEDTLDQEDVADPLDRGYSPNESPRGVDAFGTTAREQSEQETIDQRILQEEPDPTTAYGAPDDESGMEEDERLGGDDPDSIDAEDDWVGDDQVGNRRAGRLVAEDEGAHEDTDKDSFARDVGIDGAAASAEEAAVHIIDEPWDRD